MGNKKLGAVQGLVRKNSSTWSFSKPEPVPESLGTPGMSAPLMKNCKAFRLDVARLSSPQLASLNLRASWLVCWFEEIRGPPGYFLGISSPLAMFAFWAARLSVYLIRSAHRSSIFFFFPNFFPGTYLHTCYIVGRMCY